MNGDEAQRRARAAARAATWVGGAATHEALDQIDHAFWAAATPTERFIASIELAETAWAFHQASDDELLPDLIDLLEALDAAGVRYLVVGGHAVGAHSKPRATKDLDLWLEPSPPNIARAVDALVAFRAPPNVVEALRVASANDVVWLGKPPGRVDLLLSLPALEFDPAWTNRIEIRLGSLTVPVIGRDDLIRNKEAVGRPQDRRDVRALRGASRPAGTR